MPLWTAGMLLAAMQALQREVHGWGQLHALRCSGWLFDWLAIWAAREQ